MKRILFIALLFASTVLSAQSTFTRWFPASGTNTYATNVLSFTGYNNTVVQLKFSNPNTDASTIAINGSTAVPIRKWDGDSWELLVGGEIDVNTIYKLSYLNGGNYFQLEGLGGGGITNSSANTELPVTNSGSGNLIGSGITTYINEGEVSEYHISFLGGESSSKFLYLPNTTFKDEIYLGAGRFDPDDNLFYDIATTLNAPLEITLTDDAGSSTLPATTSTPIETHIQTLRNNVKQLQDDVGSGGLTVGSTTITSGTTGRLLYDNAGVLGEYSSLPVSFGGTGLTSLGTANQQLRVNAGGTALEYFTATPNPLTSIDDIIRSSDNLGTPARLAVGTAYQILRVSSGGSLGYGSIDVSQSAAITGLLPYANFSNGAGLSVVGRSANTSGVQADIVAATDGNVLRRSGTTLGFGSLDLTAAGTVGSSILGIANGGTGSSTVPYYLLASGGTASASNTRTFNTASWDNTAGTFTATANDQFLSGYNGTITARGTASDVLSVHQVTGTLTAGANGQRLIGLRVKAPTFTNGAFTGLTNDAAHFEGTTRVGIPSGNGSLVVQNTSGSPSSMSLVALGATGNFMDFVGSVNMRIGGSSYITTDAGLALTTISSIRFALSSGSLGNGVSQFLSMNGTFNTSSGAGNDNASIRLKPTINTSGGTTQVGGFLWDPTRTSLTGVTEIAFGSTGGLSHFGSAFSNAHSTLQSGGSFATAYVTKTANYTLTTSDRNVVATANSFTLTLPTAVGIAGREYFLVNTGSGTITIATTSSQTIDLAAPGSLGAGNVTPTSLSVVSDGANWLTRSSNTSSSGLLELNYTLTASQITNSFTSPVAILTPPAGYEVVIVGYIYVKKTYAGAAFSGNTNSSVVLQGNGVVYTTGTELNNLMVAGTDATTIMQPQVTGNLNVLGGGGVPIYFKTNTSDPAGGGTSTITVKFFYKLMPI